jgi:elongator complex protein 3
MLTSAREFVIKAYKEGIRDAKRMQELKAQFSSRNKRGLFSNVELIDAYRILVKEGALKEDESFLKALRKRGVRSQSGIASITVITKAYACSGTCIFCPTEPGMPKSYLSNEPAVMRAILNDFDPYRQTINRLGSLEKSGHHTDKIDVIISGGTFSFYPKQYQTDFVRGIYNALNSPAKRVRSLQAAQDINEKAGHRCIGLSVETRPDHIDERELIRLRKLGCTKIEIGVQSLNDRVLALNKRGHTVEETKRAIRLMRDAAYKINCHMMPGLYGSTPENDYADFIELFGNPAYRPDWLKVYPCMVVPWSQLEKLYKKGDFVPYGDGELMDLLIKIKQVVPEYCRITRLYRDIPAPTVIGGSKISNIRQLMQERMKKEGLKCRCIRCREVKGESVEIEKLKMKVDEFDASGGREFFITFNDPASGKNGDTQDKLAALLRLRFSSYSVEGRKHFIKELEGAALIREVHTYGEQVRVAGKGGEASQHIGLGRRMMTQAEEISRKNGFKKIAVISGIGVREYYRKLGYRLEGTYMMKGL